LAAQPTWEPVGRVPTYELVLRRIEEQLLSRSLRPGDKLPPERELATMLGASRPAVREALRVLQAQGILRSSVGTRPRAWAMASATWAMPVRVSSAVAGGA